VGVLKQSGSKDCSDGRGWYHQDRPATDLRRDESHKAALGVSDPGENEWQKRKKDWGRLPNLSGTDDCLRKKLGKRPQRGEGGDGFRLSRAFVEMKEDRLFLPSLKGKEKWRGR